MAKNLLSNFLLMFDRPQEPLFTPKGEAGVIFDLPQQFLPSLYQNIGLDLFSQFSNASASKVNIKKVEVPDVTEIQELSRHSNFSLFIPKHRTLAAQLITMFMKFDDVEDLLSVVACCRDRINPYLFQYALTVTLMHRKDTQQLDLPSFVHCFPGKYVDSKVFVKAREEAAIIPDGSRQPIEIPRDYTANDREIEHRIAYFREDIGVNLHHWHWHLVYPYEGPDVVVNKNRRGELFYYMHQQLVGRYNFERFCNSLHRVERFNEWHKPIAEAYFPKLNSMVASRGWPARVANQTLQDLRREADDIRQDVSDLATWRDRILSVISSGFALKEDGTNMKLTEFEGIDILGNIIESSSLSINRQHYGDFHNMGHVFISYIHDPDGRHLEQFGVIGDNATAMRDPLFYRWHAFVDDLFQQYKATQPKYTAQQLDFADIEVSDIKVETPGGMPNAFHTYWKKSDVDLSRGMDFQPRGPVFVRFTHLNHVPFKYRITVQNKGKARFGTVRIFLAPKTDERGQPWIFRDQRRFFIELDRFRRPLIAGENVIVRSSDRSSVTIPWERSFRDLDTKRPSGGNELAKFNFCGCGWPNHMLIPKGTVDGFNCELFVMISNYNDDRVKVLSGAVCNDADSFCGVKDNLYPDARHMGFPFDRVPRSGVDTLKKFMTKNMCVRDVKIYLSAEEPTMKTLTTAPEVKPKANDDDTEEAATEEPAQNATAKSTSGILGTGIDLNFNF